MIVTILQSLSDNLWTNSSKKQKSKQFPKSEVDRLVPVTTKKF